MNRLILIVIMFFVFGALLVASNNGLALGKAENAPLFKALYLDWIDSLVSNIRSVTGNVISQDWFPSESNV